MHDAVPAPLKLVLPPAGLVTVLPVAALVVVQTVLEPEKGV
jgi:hypothetical protein